MLVFIVLNLVIMYGMKICRVILKEFLFFFFSCILDFLIFVFLLFCDFFDNNGWVRLVCLNIVFFFFELM